MRVWFYCSYSGSPVGFQLGFVDADRLSETLREGAPPRLLDRCLSYQGVREAFGEIPSSSERHDAPRVWAAVRPISRREEDTAYLNFAFETEDKDEFRHILGFLEQYRDRDAALYQKMRPLIREERGDSAFGIRVNTAELEKVLKEVRGAAAGGALKNGDGFCVRTHNAAQGKALRENLRLDRIYPEIHYDFQPVPALGGDWFQMRPVSIRVPDRTKSDREEEDHTHPFPLIPAIAVAVVAAILLAALLLTKQEQAEPVSIEVGEAAITEQTAPAQILSGGEKTS